MGGPVFKVGALARGLVKRGHQVTVLTADLGLRKHMKSGTATFAKVKGGWRSEQDGVEVIYLSSLGQYRAATLNPGIVRFCRSSLGQFDVVHIYGIYDLLGPAVARFCRRRNIPYVIEPMGMFRPIVRSLPLKRSYHRILGKPLIGGACYLIATSGQEKNELIEDGVASSRIVVRRNGIDLPEKRPISGEFRRGWNIGSNVKVILFLGRLISKKSPDLLLEAFAAWRTGSANGESILVLAGPEEGDGFVPGLKKMAANLGITEYVLFPGALYDEAKWAAYGDADVFVLPSQNENFGNTAAESAACGTPVIVTDRCGIAPFVGRAGLVVQHDGAALAAALKCLLEDSTLREHCREGCNEMVQALSWKSLSPKMRSSTGFVFGSEAAHRSDWKVLPTVRI